MVFIDPAVDLALQMISGHFQVSPNKVLFGQDLQRIPSGAGSYVLADRIVAGATQVAQAIAEVDSDADERTLVQKIVHQAFLSLNLD